VRPDLLIRDARRAAGLTQAELAANLGVSQSAVAKLERAGANPTVETLDRTLRATGHRLQLIAPSWGTASGEPGPSIDVSLVRQQLLLDPGQRIVELEAMYADMAKIAAAGARARAGGMTDAPWPVFRPTRLLRRLVDGHLDFVVVGGVAVIAQASPRLTKHLDICYSREPSNLEALGAVLVAAGARLRGVDEDVPFVPDARTLQRTTILTLRTVDGDIHLLVEPSGCPPYEALKAHADRIDVEGSPVLVASIDDLIAMKRAAGRPQDLIDLEALEIARSRPD
jgi:transcriptional regulator with XRE-family HTH domain